MCIGVLTLEGFSWKVSSRTEVLGLVICFRRGFGWERLVGRSCVWVILDVWAGSTHSFYFRRIGRCVTIPTGLWFCEEVGERVGGGDGCVNKSDT